jgi:NADPH:quinone reductase-like Zn-dependent oxidoreductase
LGAEVTGVCSTRNVDLARSLGADHVVDDTREDFTHDAGRYGVVFDLVGNRSLTELRRALTPTGTLLLSGGGVSTGGSLIGPFALALKVQKLARFVRRRLVTMTGEPPIKEHRGRHLDEVGGAGRDAMPAVVEVVPHRRGDRLGCPVDRQHGQQ